MTKRSQSPRIVRMMVVGMLLTFFSVPIGFLLYGGLGSAFGGMALIGCLVIFQLPVFLLMNRFGWLPKPHRQTDESA